MTLRSKFWIHTAAFLFVFAILLQTGFWLAGKKFLWNDEIFTQFSSINQPYKEMLLGEIQEGSNSPLFYVGQKLLCDLAHSDATQRMENAVGAGNHFPWYLPEAYSQIFLRINSVFFMSLAISLIFYFFLRFYSVWGALYSLLLSISSFTVWVYWAEARPYSLWFLLTTTQSLLFLCLMELRGNVQADSSVVRRAWHCLAANHLILSFSSIFSIMQILIVSFLLWIFLEKDWRKYLALTVLPSMVCMVYYRLTPRYHFIFNDTPWQLINANFPKDRLVITVLFAVFLLFDYFLISKQKPKQNKSLSERSYLALTFLMLLVAGIVLWKFKMEEPADHKGFAISNRYFIYLTPVGIISTTLFSISIFRSLTKKVWLQIFFLIFIGLLSVGRIDRTYELLKSYFQFQ